MCLVLVLVCMYVCVCVCVHKCVSASVSAWCAFVVRLWVCVFCVGACVCGPRVCVCVRDHVRVYQDFLFW